MKIFYIITFILICVLALIFASFKLADQTEKVSILPSDNIHQILEKTVINEGIPSIVAAIIDSNGVVQIGSAGVRKMGSLDPITNQDKLHLGSCTKAMTSAMLAILVDEGLLSWESTIGEIFNDLKDSIHHAYHDVTVYQLVRHRGGIIDNASNWWQYSDMEKDKTRRKEIKERRKAILLDNLKNAPQKNQGEFLYSNLGYMIAGSMAAQVTGNTWEELMTKKLFDPLKMTTAGFGSPGTKGKIDQPWGHNNAWLSGWNPVQGDNAEALGPAGTVHCSLEDWGKFIAFQFLDDSQKHLSSLQLANLKTPEGDYAAGWNKLERPWAKGHAFTHSGSNTMWLSVAWVAPETGKAYLVVTNAMNPNMHKVCDGVIGQLLKLDGAIASEQ